MEQYYRVGFGRIDITPEESVPLAGYGNTSMRFFQNIRDRLIANCVAISDQADSTVLLFDVDLIVMDEPVLGLVREGIEKNYGVPGDRVMICATHTHAGPDIWNTKEPSIVRYHQLLSSRLVQAAGEALQDRKEAQLYYGTVEVPNMNFVKHYCHTTEDGKTLYFGDNFGKQVLDETTRHATDSDPSLHVLQFVRQGGRDIVIGNWRAHPHFTSGSRKYDLSADYPGAFRKALEAMKGCHAVFFQGCGGNNNSSTRLVHERRYTTCDSYGMALAASAVECLNKKMTLAAGGSVKAKQLWLEYPLDHRDDGRVEEALKVQKVWQETNDAAKATEAGRPYGIRSPYHANAIVSKSKRPASKTMEINAMAFGPDVAIVTGSEMFDTISIVTEQQSVFAATVTMAYFNAYRGYIPSNFGFEYTCYESDVAWFAPGIAEKLIETYTDMLKELKD